MMGRRKGLSKELAHMFSKKTLLFHSWLAGNPPFPGECEVQHLISFLVWKHINSISQKHSEIQQHCVDLKWLQQFLIPSQLQFMRFSLVVPNKARIEYWPLEWINGIFCYWTSWAMLQQHRILVSSKCTPLKLNEMIPRIMCLGRPISGLKDGEPWVILLGIWIGPLWLLYNIYIYSWVVLSLKFKGPTPQWSFHCIVDRWTLLVVQLLLQACGYPEVIIHVHTSFLGKFQEMTTSTTNSSIHYFLKFTLKDTTPTPTLASTTATTPTPTILLRAVLLVLRLLWWLLRRVLRIWLLLLLLPTHHRAIISPLWV